MVKQSVGIGTKTDLKTDSFAVSESFRFVNTEQLRLSRASCAISIHSDVPESYLSSHESSHKSSWVKVI